MAAKKLKKSLNTGRVKYPSWLTTDRQEIDLRKQRAIQEAMLIKRKSNEISDVFADYHLRRKDVSDSQEYKVEIRSLDNFYNYCSCPDFQKNFLGTCKHVEKILSKCGSQKKKGNSPFIEVFLDFSNNAKLTVMLPENIDRKLLLFIMKYLDKKRQFKKPESNTLQVFLRDMEQAEPEIYKHIRISDAVIDLNKQNVLMSNMKQIEKEYKEEIRSSALSGSFLKYPLYDYQIDGMLHLAFSGRAILADEMGLGKTVQAVAAAALMKKYFDIKRVLVVSPASLKTEWEEQINKFTDLKNEILLGGRSERLHYYKNSNAFFILSNYEQIIRDYEDVNLFLQPDLIILDEAQRIKNWKTKTALNIKRLNSKFAFILTGTPIENRIDELYSLTEFIDAKIFGSLFRFNRKFYNFDSDGKTAGFKNLRELHDTIKPVMIRRRKDEIEEQLPERIDNNYFVELTAEQKLRYEEHESSAARIMAIAKHRPLTPKEMERLQLHLSCMRMLCDTVYILDQKISDSPKVDEVLNILNDIWENSPERKIIIFSEWVRMLELVKEQLEDNKIKFSWHVGSIPQDKRRVEINNFKNDPECKVFLSTDSGGVGLNLQAASVVINMDLPWNPAKLEQRIARAWRKHQKNCVNVINLIAENTIEHRMLATLDFKQGLAEGVLDARGDIDELEQPNAKNKFMERLATIMNTSFVSVKAEDEMKDIAKFETEVPKDEIFKQELELELPMSLKLCSGVFDKDNGKLKSVFAVADNITAQQKLEETTVKTGMDKENDLIVINNETYNLLQKLSKMGVISFNNSMKDIYVPNEAVKEKEEFWLKKKKIAEEIFMKAERCLKMSKVLKSGEFLEESEKPLIDSVKLSGKALAVLANNEIIDEKNADVNNESIGLIKNVLKIDNDLIMFLILCCLNGSDYKSSSVDIYSYADKLHAETAALIEGQGFQKITLIFRFVFK